MMVGTVIVCCIAILNPGLTTTHTLRLSGENAGGWTLEGARSNYKINSLLYTQIPPSFDTFSFSATLTAPTELEGSIRLLDVQGLEIASLEHETQERWDLVDRAPNESRAILPIPKFKIPSAINQHFEIKVEICTDFCTVSQFAGQVKLDVVKSFGFITLGTMMSV